MAQDLKAPVNILRICTVILGVVVLGVGLHSHFQSLWVKRDFHNSCRFPQPRACPDISMERYFVAMIIICFIISVLIIASSFVLDWSNSPYNMVDMAYHAISSLLLLIAGIVYLVSTEQISKLFGSRSQIQLRGEKLAGGSLVIIEAVLYLGVALMGRRQ